MTDPESHYSYIHWPVRSTSNLTGNYNKNPETYQIFHPPVTPTLLTYLQQKEQAINPYSMYVISNSFVFLLIFTSSRDMMKRRMYFENIFLCLSSIILNI